MAPVDTRTTFDTLSLPWGRLAYERVGRSGPCLIFLHGTGCDNRDWDSVRTHLPTDGFRCIFLEFRGHGNSSVSKTPFTLEDLADDALALLDHLGISQAHWVGHSLGGMVSLAAARKSKAAAGLVLLEGWTSLKAAAAFAPGRFYGRLDADAITRIKTKAAATIARHNPDQWRAFWSSVEAFDGSDVLADPGMPIREVYGALGRLPETQARLLVPEHPRITWQWLPDCGHYLSLEKPAEIAAGLVSAISPAQR
jgi:pimeloyl-ACP methyl ester carboxylesterase